MTVVPDYYKDFICTASKCRHNCCVGWEIDIDAKTAAKYAGMAAEGREGDPLKERFRSAAQKNEDGTLHFILTEDGRCPFLLDSGLCELICSYGEDILCSICADHPRFRNFKKDHVEMGIGLACEEAARIIISRHGPASYEILETGEPAVPDHKKFMLSEPIEVIPDEEIDWDYFADFFLSLERLDEEWTGYLTDLLENPEMPHQKIFRNREWKERFENIKEYLLYRHLKRDGRDFVELCWNLIIKLMDITFKKTGHADVSDLINIARLFSAEIEYSDENTDIIKEELEG